VFRNGLVVVAFGVMLAACESDTAGPDDPLPSGEVEINASAANQFTYFSLADGEAVQVSNPATSNAWDLAFRRFEVRLNGGVVGAKGVAGYNLANNADATPAEVLAFTPANQKAAFDAVTAAQVPAASLFAEEALAANPLGWLAFGPQGPVANPGAAWKVRRSSSGGFAVFRTIALTLGGTGQNAVLNSVTIEWRHQPASGALGAKQTATLDVAGGTGAINFSTGATSAGTGCEWDLRAAATFAISPNAACQAGTAPLSAAESFDALTTAGDALQYGAFLSGFSGPVPFTANLDDPEGPYLYNLAGDNRISPTFNIYLVKVGSAVFKVQVIGYYNSTGASGYPTIRYAQIQ
jgi:hypothetical protein